MIFIGTGGEGGGGRRRRQEEGGEGGGVLTNIIRNQLCLIISFLITYRQ